MKRPQSAKPGYRQLHTNSNFEDFRQEADINHHKHPHHRQVKLMKPDLTTNDFSRAMPKKIYQDKERLYSDALQLKQQINKVTEENIRLKTRISILEKEKEKLNRYLESAAENSNKANNRFNLCSGTAKESAKENMMVRNLKKMVRDSKDEIEYLKQENIKVKKAIKYTKINELEIQRKMLLEENQRINVLVADMNEELGKYDRLERENQELKEYLKDELEANKQLSESNQRSVEYIEELEEKLQKEYQRAEQKEKKLQRELALQKRKLNESIKMCDDLRKELKQVRESSAVDMKKKLQKPLIRPMSSHPYSQTQKASNAENMAVSTEINKDYENIKHKNNQLEKELQQLRRKLQSSQAALMQKASSNTNEPKFILHENQPNKHSEQQIRLNSENQQEEYSNDFVLPNTLKEQNKEAIEHYSDEGFEKSQEEEAEQLYKKVVTKEAQRKQKSPQQGKSAKKANAQRAKSATKKAYKPNKKILTELKQLLTYRMKAQRYCFKELQKDINDSKEQQFSCMDLQQMLKQQPFFLNQRYLTAFLQYAFGKERPENNQKLTAKAFLDKTHKFIEDFELMDEEEEEKMLMRIAQMTTKYPAELQEGFEEIKNGDETVPKDKMVAMFRNIELPDKEIEAIIAELSLGSEDLDHLNYVLFFQRFFIEDEYENAINEQNMESSEEGRATNPIPNIPNVVQQQESEEEKAQFIHDGSQQTPMQKKGKKNTNFIMDNEVISDDGHI